MSDRGAFVHQLQSFSTDAQPASRRIDYWHHITSVLTMQEADPFDRNGFRGRMKYLDLGSVRMAELQASASRVRHTRAHLGSSAQPTYLLRVALRGEVTAIQDGREARLRAGDFTLCDTTRPYEILSREPFDVLVIRVPHGKLLPLVRRPEAALAVRMAGDSGLSGLVSRHLRELWSASPDFLSHGASRRLSEMSMQLLASAYSVLPKSDVERSSLVSARRARVVELVERDLSDPELTPARIAGELGVSVGYLHRVFSSDEGDTVSRYILKRRLEEVARGLRDPRQAARSITSIAFGMGFNSLAHFSRVFRERFGVSARDYRHG